MPYFAYERRGEKALLLLGTAPSRRYPARYIERGIHQLPWQAANSVFRRSQALTSPFKNRKMGLSDGTRAGYGCVLTRLQGPACGFHSCCRGFFMKGSIQTISIADMPLIVYAPPVPGPVPLCIYLSSEWEDFLGTEQLIRQIMQTLEGEVRRGELPPFLLASAVVSHWDDAYSPWPADCLPGRHFSGGAEAYFGHLQAQVHPFLQRQYGGRRHSFSAIRWRVFPRSRPTSPPLPRSLGAAPAFPGRFGIRGGSRICVTPRRRALFPSRGGYIFPSERERFAPVTPCFCPTRLAMRKRLACSAPCSVRKMYCSNGRTASTTMACRTGISAPSAFCSNRPPGIDKSFRISYTMFENDKHTKHVFRAG